MNAKIVLWLILFVSVTACAKSPIVIQKFNTDNGVPVLFTATHELPMLDLTVTFRAGSARDGDLPGLAQFTNAMLNEGTEKLDADAIAAAFEDVGAQFGASVGQDMAIVSLRTLSEQKILTAALKTFAEVLTATDFPRVAIKRIRKQMVGALEAEEQQPASVAINAYFSKLYADQPYAHAVLGDAASVAKIKRGDLLDFYRKYYVTENAMIVIVGDASLAQAKTIANQIAQQLPHGAMAPKLALDKSSYKKTTTNIKFPSEQTHIILGQIGIAKNDPDFFPLMVGNYILGQAPLVADLFIEVRTKLGLAYNIESNFATMEAPGPFAIELQTSNNQAQQASAVAMQTLQHFMQQGPTTAQLRAARNGINGQFVVGLSNNQSIAAILTSIGFYNLPLNYLDDYLAKVNAVTLEQIRAAFKRHLNPDDFTVVMVGNSAVK